MECVSECPTHILDRVRSLSVQVKASKGELKCWKRPSDDCRRAPWFSTCIVPREIRGSDEGLMDRATVRKPVQHFLMSGGPMRGLMDGAGAGARKPVQHSLMSGGQVEDIIWEIERRKLA
ncbi:hypothetical protein TNIN_136341 [Trichonephila inaurata madagascariensis]|uniref:Uncharacterized protein n=1 Tax=Trichonephila inaurata madagascariensis TaxID=2747483 RepID=A0A8X6I2T5_9ARAC|nr:hypothetical protein TNIN_136341 [Trichonephila inaurata madagascariensis]